jgi:hypothetical protein
LKAVIAMPLLEDIIKIPRKLKGGATANKINVTIYIDSNTNTDFKAVAKEYHTSVSGLIELAMIRILADIATAKAETR